MHVKDNEDMRIKQNIPPYSSSENKQDESLLLFWIKFSLPNSQNKNEFETTKIGTKLNYEIFFII